MTSKIFISYRRSDTGAAAGRLYDFLEAKFGEQALFKDVDNMPYGRDFQEEIRNAIDASVVVLVVIGRYFVTEEKRLFMENDYVHYEISYALQKGKIVIPVIVNDAVMPSSNHLPAKIKKLSTIHGPELRNTKWRRDCEDFYEQLRVIYDTSKTSVLKKLEQARALYRDKKHQEAFLIYQEFLETDDLTAEDNKNLSVIYDLGLGNQQDNKETTKRHPKTEEEREAIFASLERGLVLEGLVTSISDFGVFLDLGGVDGLLYITDISWERINHPNEVLSLNQRVNVVVLDFDENKKRISLGLKQLQPHPWEILSENIKEGSVVKGKIVNIEDSGALLEIQPGIEGLIRVSEITWSNRRISTREYFSLGKEYKAKVLTIDREDRKMSLSIKQLEEDPWDTFEIVFSVGSYHRAPILYCDERGAIVQLLYGLEAFAPIKHLRKEDGSLAEIDEVLDFKVIEFNRADNRILVSHSRYLADFRKEAH